MAPLTGKRVKNPKKSAIFHHILLKGHEASFEDVTVFLKGNNKFKLHLKESLLIKRDKPELNRNIYSYPLEIFDWLIDFIICILLFTYLLIWFNYPCNFHDILSNVDSRSLLFENASDERRKQKLILFKINTILWKIFSLISWNFLSELDIFTN